MRARGTAVAARVTAPSVERVRSIVVAGIGWILGVGGCVPQPAFECEQAEQCRDGGVAGFCESSGACSFPSADCPSRRRYGAHAEDGLAGQCVQAQGTVPEIEPHPSTGEVETCGESSSTGAWSEGSSGGVEGSSGGDESEGSSGGNESEGSSGGDEPGAGSTGIVCPFEGVLPSCLEQYGTHAGFILCEETPTSCRFSASTAGIGCDGVCGEGSGICLSAAGNGEDACIPTSPSTCDRTGSSNDLCVCSRGC